MTNEYYFKKVIYSYNTLEYLKYSRPVHVGIKRTKKYKKTKNKVKKINYTSKTKLRRLIQSNPDLNKFVTLTFADNVSDLKTANYEFKKFILRFKYEFDNIKYIAVPEFQKRGAVHYHVLMNFDYIKSNQFAEIWQQGFIKIKELSTLNGISVYMTKYLTKAIEDVRYFKKKKYFTSRNILKPLVFYDDQAAGLLNIINKKKEFDKKYYSPYNGYINYKSFKII